MSEPGPRSRVRRRARRASYDAGTIHAILDEALICHVGFVRDGDPVVIPTIHARMGNAVYLHGSPAAGFVRDLRDGAPVCITATIVDGLVLARSANNSSMNYRSAVLHGRATEVTDPDEKRKAFEAITEHVVPGRWPHLRGITDEEIRTTALLRIDVEEASAKLRSGPPRDPEDDAALPIWAGVIPLRLEPGSPEPDEDVPEGLTVPDHITRYMR